MPDLVRVIAVGSAMGAIFAALLSAPNWLPAALASDTPAARLMDAGKALFPAPFDPDGLVKYDLTFADSVSTEVQSTDLVRKIGYGHSSLVTIAHTASGVYSSDGLASPHVRYPGVEVRVTPLPQMVQSFGAYGWVPGPISYHGSFVTIADAASL